MKTTLETISYGGWPNSLRLSDGRTEAVITTDVGPRIIRYGRVGGPNVLKEFSNQLGKTGGSKWRIYGGHRLWVAPEDRKLTYVPDNEKVQWKWNGTVLHLAIAPDALRGLKKELFVSMDASGSLRINHRISNGGRKTVDLAAWCLTVMTTGGRAIFPQEDYGSHVRNLLPARPLVLWKYTDMSDARWGWGRKYFTLKQNVATPAPQKVGFLNTKGWMAYALGKDLFVKRHAHQNGAVYPDFGCNAETFTNDEFLELESLGPVTRLAPGRRTEHGECWNLFAEKITDFSDAGLDRRIPALVKKTRSPDA